MANKLKVLFFAEAGLANRCRLSVKIPIFTNIFLDNNMNVGTGKSSLVVRSLLLGVVWMIFLPNAEATPSDICEMRSALLGSVAQERDKGVSRTQVKKTLTKNLKAMGPWVDIIYDRTKGMTPNQVAAMVKAACLAEGD